MCSDQMAGSSPCWTSSGYHFTITIMALSNSLHVLLDETNVFRQWEREFTMCATKFRSPPLLALLLRGETVSIQAEMVAMSLFRPMQLQTIKRMSQSMGAVQMRCFTCNSNLRFRLLLDVAMPNMYPVSWMRRYKVASSVENTSLK